MNKSNKNLNKTCSFWFLLQVLKFLKMLLASQWVGGAH